MNNKRTIAFFVIIVGIMLAGAGVWYWHKNSYEPASQPSSVSGIEADQKFVDVSLGNQILQKTQNILKNRFPETNPLKQIIKNPF